MKIVWNALAFQIGWLACALGGAYLMPWAGALFALGLIAIHLLMLSQPRREVILLAIAATIGAVWDSLLVAVGWVQYPSGTLLANTAPYWIVIMWVLFASTLNVSLRWLRGRWLLAALFGSIGAPLAYYAGERLGGVELLAFEPALAALALSWALFVPALVKLSMHFDGTARPATADRVAENV